MFLKKKELVAERKKVVKKAKNSLKTYFFSRYFIFRIRHEHEHHKYA